jgi:hypothetical protein
MRKWMALVAAMAAALAVTAAVNLPASAQEGGDLDCGDPGTSHNMPVDPANDPHGLDADDDGIGCEDPAAFGGDSGGGGGDEAPAAEPVEGEPSFTG